MSFSPKSCPYSNCELHTKPGGRFKKKGFFKLKRLNKTIRRFECTSCKKSFSSRTFKADYRHKKPDLNDQLEELLCDGFSLRACSRFLKLTYRNTYRKALWLKAQARLKKSKLRFKA